MGENLTRQWQGSPEVYLSTVADDCPNCFLTFDPNLYTFTSAFVIMEAQLKLAMDHNVHAVEVAKIQD